MNEWVSEKERWRWVGWKGTACSYRKRKIVAHVKDGTPIVVADKRKVGDFDTRPFHISLSLFYTSHTLLCFSVMSRDIVVKMTTQTEIARLFMNDKCISRRYIGRMVWTIGSTKDKRCMRAWSWRIVGTRIHPTRDQWHKQREKSLKRTTHVWTNNIDYLINIVGSLINNNYTANLPF